MIILRWPIGFARCLVLRPYWLAMIRKGNRITEVCRANGIKIPEEIAVLGVDNDAMTCNLSDPPLSSIDLNIEKGGYEAAQLIEKA